MQFENNNTILEKNRVLNYLKGKEIEMQTTGATTDEISLLEGIVSDLISNKITPEEAERKTNSIESKRQDYH